MKKYLYALVILLSILVLSGCQSEQKGLVKLHTEPQFSSKQLALYQVAVMPAVNADTKLLAKDSEIYGTSLVTQLKKQFPTELKIVSGTELSGYMGTSPETVAQYFLQHGVLPLSARTQIALNAKHLRYLFYIKVNEDTVTHKMTSNPVTNMVQVKGKRQVFNTYITVRDVNLSLALYDLDEKKIVWENNGVLAKTTTLNKRLLLDEDKLRTQRDTAHYPDAAALIAMLPSLYQGILQSIPH